MTCETRRGLLEPIPGAYQGARVKAGHTLDRSSAYRCVDKVGIENGWMDMPV